MTAALTARSVQKRFGAAVALSNAALTLERGEVHALVGANGCGKSTLSKIIAGTVQRDSGDIVVNGAPLVLSSPAEAEANGISLFYQELSLIPQMSVEDNIFLGREPRNGAGFVDRKALAKKADALLQRFAPVAGRGLNSKARVSDLSPDQRQIVEIVKVLARDPDVVIFDEATAALDHRQVELFFRIIGEMKDKGVSFLFISHRLAEVFAVCDRITVMRNGESVDDFVTAETDMDTVVRAMVGDIAHDLDPAPSTDFTSASARLVVQGARGQRLQDVSFSLRPGEILGLGGLQGQGQSILLQSLFGAEPLTGGRVLIEGRPVVVRTPRAAVRHGFGYVSGDRGRDSALQGRSIFENMAIAEWVAERRRLVWPGRLQARLSEIAQSLNTKYPSLDAPIDALSGGNQQKVFIARWLATNPVVLLLDDPTKGIDLAAKADFFRLVRNLAAAGAAVLFYSSEDAELIGLCHRVLVFNSGRIVAELERAELTSFNLTGAAYGSAA
ncbi:sugar ABC transporter ATP-binding protein [Consotaella salsifontis]|uniref:Monosaccharide ABC transporter ATP-binding protein, CUT2 family n=1 Tax=Consotaella salsifontis TaxID=1365950 RepID=A0A1T4TB49_9HYPH|nr:sugar ABC transporter ATP-binding protein [Consotaella salsifontis]SKA37722.1 monosaccharide ABC transporter ATP-binding protein, CUT2 family [Consotaella salsifontis]